MLCALSGDANRTMNAQLADDSTTTVAAIVADLKGRLSTARNTALHPLIGRFFRRVESEELALRSDHEWAALMLGLIDLSATRPGGRPLVRVFNPTRSEHGFESTHTVIQVVNDDMPFLVDSVSIAINRVGAALHSVVHPVAWVERDAAGHLIATYEDSESPRAQAESYMHIEVDRRAEAEQLLGLKDTVLRALADVRATVTDWEAMRARARSIAEELKTRAMPIDDANRAEAVEFMQWLADNHFTFLGFREYRVAPGADGEVLAAVENSGLGILRGQDRAAPRPLTSLAAHRMDRSGTANAIIVTKTNSRSTVHRSGYMDYVGVLSFDANGRAIGEERFLGLFTSSAYSRRPWEIPVVRQKYDAVMQRSGLRRESHSGKALRNILEDLPRDELMHSTAEELGDTALGVLRLQGRQRTRLFVRQDRYGRFFSILVFIPRERFNPTVRDRIERLLTRAFIGEHVDSTIQVGDAPLARIHLVIRPRKGTNPQPELAALEAEITEVVRSWHDALRDYLVRKHGEQRGLDLSSRFGRSMSVGYMEQVSAETAAEDVASAALLTGPDDIRLDLDRSADDPNRLRFKLFRFDSPLALSDALPMFENLGMRILTEHPYQFEVGDRTIFLQDFEVAADPPDLNVERVRERFQQAFERVWRGQSESDGFNRLVLHAGLDWRQVAMLRAYLKYLLQTGVPFSQAYVEQTVANYPLHARLLAELFAAKFDPSREQSQPDGGAALLREWEELGFAAHLHAHAGLIDDIVAARTQPRAQQVAATTAALLALMDRVESLDEDRILRAFMAVIKATLRTNFYQLLDGRPRDTVSFKLDPAQLPDLPKPRPYREIFVCGPRVEGVHLRFGAVARGGLRWSDRREDFRTEVLGLVKAQMVKNTVIVPVGAKGGFYVKRPPVGGDRDAQLAEGIACYKSFINGLLDITDNLVEGTVAHPDCVVRHDADDPYLVVAADKGTATFSDIANGLALERGFWLGDAFASGGSVGYDHKGMGITAKGGWESVKRHFRAMGRNSQTQDFTCVGVGDMSGDVFGNGMLLSKHIRLLAAFDHRHIFLDPDPGTAASFAERTRLFGLARSSWDDYDRNLISKGGGVFPRSAKTIEVSAAARNALGIDGEGPMSPNDLMRAILLAPVDLLWNGGIGTYVKAVGESHADVGDRANNAIRVDGGELRCKVVGEGGNLGCTQRGRIEAALAGVLLNTDFIDNSAGVDTSDHEVNIKILLNEIVAHGALDMASRNELLAEMTGEVEILVLRDNYLQNQAISLMESMSVQRLGAKRHFVRVLEERGLLDRQLEFLPSEAEFDDRRARGLGLTRPELAVLLSYAKLVLFQQLLDSDVPEDPYLSKELIRYFPNPLQKRFGEAMQRHRLRREIIATAVTNSVVNRMGATFVLRMQEDTGESPGEIAKAYSIAREIFDARDLWAAIEALDDRVAAQTQVDAQLNIWGLMRQLTRWLLNLPGNRLDIAATVARYHAPLAELLGGLAEAMTESDRSTARAAEAQWLSRGLSPELAQRLSLLPAMGSALDIVEVALQHKRPVRAVASIFFALGDSLHLRWLMEKIEELPVEGRWHANARGSLRDELVQQQRAVAAQVLERNGETAGGASGSVQVARWLDRDEPALRFTRDMLKDLSSQKQLDYPTVSVVLRRLGQLVQTGTAR